MSANDTTRMRAPKGMRAGLRKVGSVGLAVALAAATLTTIVAAGATASSAYTSPTQGIAASSIPSSDGPIVVAVVLGQSGTDAADALAPYEVFARSTRFSVYTVAATSAPVALNGGLSVMPTFTFADAASGAAPAPDLIVVPAVDEPDGASEAELRKFVLNQYDRGGQILGICAGARVLAATGLLDGHHATSHWSRLAQLRESRPQVDWIAGQRYVQDGRITTSAGVTSGIPAALRVVQQLASDAEAERIGQEMAYPSWSLDGSTAIPAQRFAPSDLGVGLNAVLPWFRPTVGVALADGVSEVDAVAPFEVGSYSAAARVVPFGIGSSVITAHGLVLLTTPATEAPPAIDRVLIPETGDEGDRAALGHWAGSEGRPAAALRTASGHGGFDAALEDLAAHDGRVLASSTAKMIDYPTVPTAGSQQWAEPRTIALLVLAMALTVLAGFIPRFLRGLWTRRRRTRSPSVEEMPAPETHALVER